MKNSLLLIALLAFGLSFGQSRDLVHLRNGSAVRGLVIEKTLEIVKVRTKDGSIMVFNSADVLSIESYTPAANTSGYYLEGSVALLGGPSGGSVSAQLLQGYKFSNHWQSGVGFGYENVAFNSYMPVFLEGKFNLLNKGCSPFVKIMSGYMVPMNFRESKGGFTAGAAIGYTYNITQRLGLTTSLGYRFARLVEMNNWWWDDFETIRMMNRFELRFGVTIR